MLKGKERRNYSNFRWMLQSCFPQFKSNSKSMMREAIISAKMTAISMAAMTNLLSPSLVSAQAAAREAAQTQTQSLANACAQLPIDSYNLAFHIGGVFIVMFISGLGMLSTLFLGANIKHKAIGQAIQILKMFGIGVICATAWIHLLPDAFSQFGNPCLDAGWAAYGTNYVGLFGCIAAFAIQIIEQGAISHAHVHSHCHGHVQVDGSSLPAGSSVGGAGTSNGVGETNVAKKQESSSMATIVVQGGAEEAAAALINGSLQGNTTTTVHHHIHHHHDPALEGTDAFHHHHNHEITTTAVEGGSHLHHKHSHDGHRHGEEGHANHGLESVHIQECFGSSESGGEATVAIAVREQDTLESKTVEKNITAVVLELGILVHSLIIGLTLGVTADGSFTTLLIAICFHQMFEGMALGALVTSTGLLWRTKLLLGISYPLTTPLGIAIGVVIRNSFNSNSDTLIITQGILDSLSAGILMYNTYVELIGGEINNNVTFIAYSRNFKLCCYFSMYLGAACMAVIGIWA